MEFKDFVDFKAVKEDMQIRNVTQNENNEKVRWKEENSITWMRFEKNYLNIIFYKETYIKNEAFKRIVTNWKHRGLRTNPIALSDEYTLPSAYNSRLRISKDKLKDLMQLCEDKVIPPSHYGFYKELLTFDKASSDTDSSEDSEEDEQDD